MRHAAEKGNVDDVKEQLELGADVNQADNDCETETPLFIAAQNGHDAVVEQLIKVEADVNQADDYGRTSLWERKSLIQ